MALVFRAPAQRTTRLVRIRRSLIVPAVACHFTWTPVTRPAWISTRSTSAWTKSLAPPSTASFKKGLEDRLLSPIGAAVGAGPAPTVAPVGIPGDFLGGVPESLQATAKGLVIGVVGTLSPFHPKPVFNGLVGVLHLLPGEGGDAREIRPLLQNVRRCPERGHPVDDRSAPHRPPGQKHDLQVPGGEEAPAQVELGHHVGLSPREVAPVEIVALFDDEDILARLGELSRDHRSRCTGPDDHDVGGEIFARLRLAGVEPPREGGWRGRGSEANRFPVGVDPGLIQPGIGEKEGQALEGLVALAHGGQTVVPKTPEELGCLLPVQAPALSMARDQEPSCGSGKNSEEESQPLPVAAGLLSQKIFNRSCDGRRPFRLGGLSGQRIDEGDKKSFPSARAWGHLLS